MNEDEIKELKSKLEKEFHALLEKGEDIRSYLYYPHSLLTESVKDTLDIFLMEEAYLSISSEDFDIQKFIIYQDPLLSILLDKKDQQIDLLERLISYFLSIENYEKCTIPQRLLNTIKSKT